MTNLGKIILCLALLAVYAFMVTLIIEWLEPKKATAVMTIIGCGIYAVLLSLLYSVDKPKWTKRAAFTVGMAIGVVVTVAVAVLTISGYLGGPIR